MSGFWEYWVMRMPTGGLTAAQNHLNMLGSVGWEVVGFAAADKTIGLNEYAIILKRPRVAPFPPPPDPAPAWHADPAGRHQIRFWDGVRWTENVHDEDKGSLDYPVGEGG